jgi:hypothetical protein
MAHRTEVLAIGTGVCVGPHKPSAWIPLHEDSSSVTVGCPTCGAVERERFGLAGAWFGEPSGLPTVWLHKPHGEVGSVTIDANRQLRTLVAFDCRCGVSGAHWELRNDPDANRCGDCREANRRASV